MKGETRAKGLGDLRTVTTHHVASKPPRKGTTYLDLFALSMEKQRLEQELAGVDRRRQRIIDRLAETESAMEMLIETVEQEKAAEGSSAEPVASQPVMSAPRHGERQWKKMSIEY